MMLTEAECVHFNNLKFISEVDFKCSSHNIINDIVLHFHDYKNLKKTFSEFIHVINAENSALLLTDHCSNSVIKIYQDFKETFSKFIHITYIINFIILFFYYYLIYII